MATNPYVNKVIFGNQTVMDISDTTATEGDVISGKTFYKANGAKGTGTATTNYYSPDDTTETILANILDDADLIPFYDTSATAKKNSTWANIKTKLADVFRKNIIGTFYGAGNSATYCLLCTLHVEYARINGATEIVIQERGRKTVARLNVLFASSADTDPDLLSFTVIGGQKNYFIAKSDTSTWQIYVTKNESYSSINVLEFSPYYRQAGEVSVSVTWNFENAASLPSGRIQASYEHTLADFDDDSTHRLVTDTEKTTWNSKYNRSEANVLGAKNLLDENAATDETKNNVEFTINADGTVALDGTASADIYKTLSSCPSQAYKGISLRITLENAPSGVYLYSNKLDASGTRIDGLFTKKTDFVFTPSYSDYDKLSFGIQIDNGTALTNVTVKPMLRLESDTDSTYQPFAMTNKALTEKMNGLATVATSGSYGDLIDEPTNQSAAQYDQTVSLCTRHEKYKWDLAYNTQIKWSEDSALAGATAAYIPYNDGTGNDILVAVLADDGTTKPIIIKSAEVVPSSGGIGAYVELTFSALAHNTTFKVGII